MSASDVFEQGLLQLIFENVGYANVGDATGLRGSTVAGVFYIALHTADPGEAGNQGTSEATYTSYARVSVARAAAQWTAVAGVASNDNAITFPAATGGTNIITHFSIGSDLAGAGNLFMSGALNASLSVSSGITPSFAAGQLTVTLT